MLEVVILRLVWMRLQLGKEIAPENRTRSQLKKVKKGASPGPHRRIELAFARSGGKRRLAAEMLTVVTVHPRRR
jgi:hypothetical protein